jgi:HK97 family phage prohead protease
VKLPLQYRQLDLDERAVIDKENRTARFSVSSRTPVDKWWGKEILSHDSGAIITQRMDRGAVPLLLDHDRHSIENHIGSITSYEVRGDRLYVVAKFAEKPRADETMRDMAAGVRPNISVGYIPRDAVLQERGDSGDTYLVTKWEVVEISSVSVPADFTIGVGRAEQSEEFEVRVLEVNGSPAVFTPKRANMAETANQTNPAPATGSAPATGAESREPAQVQINVDEIRAAERTRVGEIMGYGERFSFRREADEFVKAGKSVGDFRAFILDKQMAQAEKTMVGANPLGMNQKEVRSYSLTKAIREGSEKLSGLEREASEGLTKFLGRSPEGFFVPDIALMPLAISARDLSAGVPAAGGVTIQLTVEPTLIAYLRNKMALGRAGATMMGGLTSNISLPRQTGPAQAYWLAENAPVAGTNQAFDQVGLSPKRLAALTAYSKQLVAQSSIDIENVIRDDLMSIIALAQDAAGLYGTGISNNQPTGLMTLLSNALGGTAGVYDYTKRAADVTFGGPATWLSAVAFEGHVEDCNVDLDGSATYITSPLVKSTWKTAPKAVNFPVYLWENGERGSADGIVNGYRAIATKQVKSNAVIFGKWRDSIIATWSGLDMVTDPYTLAHQNQIRVVVNLLTDINFRYCVSFAASTDAGNQ